VAGHLRHPQVRDDKVVTVLAQHGERGGAARRRGDAVAIARQQAFQHAEHGALVVHHQDVQVGGRSGRLRGAGRRSRRQEFRRAAGQVHGECAALPQGALHGDAAAVPLHNPER